jgi:predicted ATPase
MTPIIMPNYYILTGGPGAGKTAVLNELEHQGYLIVAEVARAIIKNQQAIGGNITHNGDRKKYCDLMLKESVADFIKMRAINNKVIFFDRGIPDLYSYSKRFCGGVTPAINEFVKRYRYNQKVFLFPPWPEIYCHDTERKQGLNEAIDTYHAIKEAYTACGYEMIEVPKDSIAARVDYIMQKIKHLSNLHYKAN